MKNMKVSKSSETSRNLKFTWFGAFWGFSPPSPSRPSQRWAGRAAQNMTKAWKIWKSPNLLKRPEIQKSLDLEHFEDFRPLRRVARVSAEPAGRPKPWLRHEKYESLQISWNVQKSEIHLIWSILRIFAPFAESPESALSRPGGPKHD